MAEDCFSYIPSTEQYFSEYSTPLIVLLVISAVLLVLVTGLFYQNAKIILDLYAQHCQFELVIANGIYMVVVAFCLISLAVPWLSEKFNLATLIVFSWCIFALYRYILWTAGGHGALQQMYESNSERLASGGRLKRLLYRIFGRYCVVRFSIIQFPIVSTIQSTIQIILHFIDIDQFYDTTYIFLPISLTSILLYLVAFSLLVNLIEPSFPDPKIVTKFKFLRLVVLVIKIQVAIMEIIFRQVHIECTDFDGEAWSLFNIIKQPVIMMQMVLLAFATWSLYRKEDKKNATSES
ncbi:uncharacterized protein LOC135706907 [Ochlerotatus camptorhynchus]|uniref:uncharacterized protein LOC135706907 n=1 Tax=Ochlerotatus camptorhynchus TaxID=644619 RepID=UPI0031CE35A7